MKVPARPQGKETVSILRSHKVRQSLPCRAAGPQSGRAAVSPRGPGTGQACRVTACNSSPGSQMIFCGRRAASGWNQTYSPKSATNKPFSRFEFKSSCPSSELSGGQEGSAAAPGHTVSDSFKQCQSTSFRIHLFERTGPEASVCTSVRTFWEKKATVIFLTFTANMKPW
jgi:hypothetical protein